MNTRKDYWRAVDLIRHAAPEVKPHLITVFVAFFANDNPRFNAQRFVNAANAE